MKILHIVPDLIGNKVFADMISALSEKVDNQVVFIPISKQNLYGRNALSLSKVQMIYSKCFGIIDRVLFLPKLKKINSVLNNTSFIAKVDLIHAHTLVSSGSIAYMQFHKRGIPYVVTVNSTDVNLFLKKLVFLKQYIKNILLNASGILFLNNNLRKYVLSLYSPEVANKLSLKSSTIPFGLDDIWRTTPRKNIVNEREFKVLFVGTLNDNKNILGVIKEIKRLNHISNEILLGIAGDGKYLKKIRKICSRFSWISYHGYIHTAEKIIKLYDDYDCLVLPSLKESFGMVYIEALSRGLPIVYSRGQGIDGYFPREIAGVAVNQYKSGSIGKAVLKLRKYYHRYSMEAIKTCEEFTWEQCVLKHINVYEKAIESTNIKNHAKVRGY